MAHNCDACGGGEGLCACVRVCMCVCVCVCVCVSFVSASVSVYVCAAGHGAVRGESGSLGNPGCVSAAKEAENGGSRAAAHRRCQGRAPTL